MLRARLEVLGVIHTRDQRGHRVKIKMKGINDFVLKKLASESCTNDNEQIEATLSRVFQRHAPRGFSINVTKQGEELHVVLTKNKAV